MKKLRKISLENFDRLSSSEASKLIGGKDNPTIPPGTRIIPIAPYTPKPTRTISPNVLGGTGSVSGGSGGVYVSISYPIGK